MKPVFWLFLLFILASGLSAWIGNDWGRRIGKRKLTIFMLRPKHTSTFLTILLSISLSLGCLGLYLLLDPQAREALLTPETGLEREMLVRQQQASDFNSTLQRLQNPVKIANQNQNAASGSNLVEIRHKSDLMAQVSKQPKSAPGKQNVQVAAARIQPPQSQLRPAAAPRPARPGQDQVALAMLKRTPEAIFQTQATQAPAQPEQIQPEAKIQVAPRLAKAHLPAATAADGNLEQKPRSTAQLALLKEPIFQLRVYGGRSAGESAQILDGVLALTRTYARDLGLSAGSEPLLLQPGNLAQSRKALQKGQIYQLQVKIGRVASAEQPLPVKLVLKAEKQAASFDPHALLESSRLNPADSNSLQLDLREAILALAQETRQDFPLIDIEQAPPPSTLAQQTLPIQIMRLQRSGNTLSGQIVLLAEAANLTEN